MQNASKSKNQKPGPDKKALAFNRKTVKKTPIVQTVEVKSDKIKMGKTAPNMALKGVTNEERHQLIAEAAYFRAERRKFLPGLELEDWLGAEAEIEAKLLKTAPRPIENA
jgi:hypothetical protein